MRCQEINCGGVASECTGVGVSKAFDVTLGLHQGSVYSLLLFITVMEIITRELQVR